MRAHVHENSQSMSQSDQTELDDWQALREGVGTAEQWVFVCSCGKSSVMPMDKARALKRAKGHQINCSKQGKTEVEPYEE